MDSGFLGRKMYLIFHINAGDCGACAAELWAAVENAADLAWANTPAGADVIALTGSVPPAARVALALLEGARSTPLVVVGRCAVDGYPFGRGGYLAVPELKPVLIVGGWPPVPEEIRNVLVEAARTKTRRP